MAEGEQAAIGVDRQLAALSAGGGELMARVTSDPSLEMPYGAFIPALYGLAASQFMAERGAGPEDFARVAVSARKWALLNPHARMHGAGPLSVEDVLRSRPIASPFHLFDCSVPCDGGGAVLVARADLARRWAAQPAYVLGFGEFHARGTVSDPGDLLATGAGAAAAAAFRRAALTPKDIRVAQLYDAFSSTPGSIPPRPTKAAASPGAQKPSSSSSIKGVPADRGGGPGYGPRRRHPGAGCRPRADPRLRRDHVRPCNTDPGTRAVSDKPTPVISEMNRAYFEGCAAGELRIRRCLRCEARFRFAPRMVSPLLVAGAGMGNGVRARRGQPLQHRPPGAVEGVRG